MATKLNPDAIQDRSIASIKLQDGVIPSESTVSGWGFTKNAGTITGITMNGASKGTSGVVNLGTVITDVSGKADSSAAIGTLSLSINSSNYQITLSGTKVDGTTFTVSDVIDLPLESVVVNGSYDDTTQKVILTLKNGSTIDFSIADLIDGLQSEITSTNKLSADLIEDGTTNKTVTATEKQTWNSYANVQADWNETTTTEDDYILNKPAIKAGTGTNAIIACDRYSYAKGDYSFAEGASAIAYGQTSHAEGGYYGGAQLSTFTVSGAANATNYTTSAAHWLEPGFVIGYEDNIAKVTSIANDKLSFTVDKTLSQTALNNVKIKIFFNCATGTSSHVEGYGTKASAHYSHAEGYFAKASGVSSHAEGWYTRTTNYGEHAEGCNNISHSGNSEAEQTLSSIGIGSGSGSLSNLNAVEVMKNGDVYVYGVGDYDGTNPTTADTLQDAINNASVDLATPITYSALVTLKTGGNLVPGMQYRITDYTCTTTQANTQSAGNVFDIIVTADSETELNENARAAHHTGDTYFANCDLDSWELKYCLENDTNRFAWADSSNGKGVIYYMKDEWNNECPYDFKNIKFQRWEITGLSSCLALVVGSPQNEYNFYFGAKNISGTNTVSGATYGSNSGYFYTFALKDLASGNWFDYTVVANIGLNTQFGPKATCYENHISHCVNNQGPNMLSNNVFFNVYSNISNPNATAFSVCNNNNFLGNCVDNTFGNNCARNSIGSDCFSNVAGNNFYINTFGVNCTSNKFGYGCYGNSLGNNCASNTFGSECLRNFFGNSCSNVSFGNNCNYMYLHDSCYNITFGYSCQAITVFSSVGYCDISNNARHAEILSGTKGTSSNRLAINFVANQNYTQVAGLVNGTTLRIWIAEDTVTGPSTSTGNNLAAFDGTTGKKIKDSGVALSSLYTKPSTGIPSTDLAQAVQTSLGLADTALQSYTETDPVFTASAAHGITSNDITNWNGKTSNVGTITGITMNGASKGTSGVVNLGTVITSETALSKGTTTGNGNAVTDISVSGHEITLTKGTTFLTQETDPVFGSSAAASITDSQINQWDAKVSANNGTLTIQKNGTQVATFSANQTTNQTANIQVNELPSVSASDNGKILMVVNGAWSLVTPVSIYSGTSTPDSSLGNNGDLYIQTNS